MRLLHSTILALLALALPSAVFAWGGSGHKIAAALAEANLTPKAREIIEGYLDGKSIVQFASWMDQVRETPEYRHTNGWHTAPVDANLRHTPAVAKQGGDAVTAIEDSIKALGKYKKLRSKTVAFHIKILVHAIPDYHCPGHVSYTTIPYQFNVILGNKALSYHEIWDSHVVDGPKLSQNEWVQRLNRLTPPQAAKITSGAPRDWFYETARESLIIYQWIKPETKLSDAQYAEFLNASLPLAAFQLQKAGYRLARTLNELFDQ